jgi:N utilization substance protein A
MVVNELRGEKIDVVPWSDNPGELVANALQPAKVKEVRTDEATGTAQVIVPDYQLSLAIGKEGQNARLAARLTGWRIDIKSETQASEESRAPVPAAEAPAVEAPAAEEAPASPEAAVEAPQPAELEAPEATVPEAPEAEAPATEPDAVEATSTET